MFGISFTLIQLNQAGALVHVYSDGSIHLNHGGTEMGQGLFTKVAQIVAEEFGVPLRFRAHHRDQHRQGAERLADRRLLGHGPQRHGGQDRGGRDQGAHDGLRRRTLGRREADRFRSATLRCPRGNHAMGFAELAKACRQNRVQLSHAGLLPDAGNPLGPRESHRPAVLLFRLWRGLRRSRHRHADRRNEACSRADLLHDVGASLNPALDIGQVEGAFIQGMGWLTTEELVYDAKGRLTTHAPATYKIPVASDVPRAFSTRSCT